MTKKEQEMILSFNELEKKVVGAIIWMRGVTTNDDASQQRYCNDMHNVVEDFKKKFYDILLEKDGDE